MRLKILTKEIEIIEDIIKRMASNSFLIKGWTVTLVVATFLLKGSKEQVLISFIPILIFWYLDSYYLWQERLYRELYKWVINNRPENEKYLFDLNTERLKKEVAPQSSVMFSRTLLPFYGSLIIIVLIIFYLLCISTSVMTGSQ